MNESRAGQPFDAKWYPQIVREKCEERRYATKGVEFWCIEVGVKRTSRTFRDGLEGKNVSLILGSTNVSKLSGLEDESDAEIEYQNNRYKVVACEYDRLAGKYTIALS